MYKIIVIFFASVLLTLSGCKSGIDNTSNWVGVYTSSQQGDSVKSIIITRADDNTLAVEIKILSSGYLHTYTILHHVTISTVTQAVINENDNITGATGQYHMEGSLTLNGSGIALTATNAAQGQAQEAGAALSFQGHKQ